jgi:hypothetical protein
VLAALAEGAAVEGIVADFPDPSERTMCPHRDAFAAASAEEDPPVALMSTRPSG